MLIILFSAIFILLFAMFIFKLVHNQKEYIPTAYETELIAYFKEVALNTEYDENPQRILKWKKPMNIFIFKEDEYEEQIRIIKETINGINELTIDGFKIELTNDVSKSNSILYLCNKDKLMKLDAEFFDGIDEDFAGLALV